MQTGGNVVKQKTEEKLYKLTKEMANYLAGFYVLLRAGKHETQVVIPHSKTEEGQEYVGLDIEELKRLSA